MKKIKQFLYNEFVVPVKNALHIWKDSRALKRAIKYADHLSLTHNHRKYVVMKDENGNYTAFHKDNFKLMKLPRRGRFDRRVTWSDILRDCTYQTPTKAN